MRCEIQGCLSRAEYQGKIRVNTPSSSYTPKDRRVCEHHRWILWDEVQRIEKEEHERQAYYDSYWLMGDEDER